MQLNYFKLFSSCIVVSGIKRSTICDLQRHQIHLISNDLRILLKRLKNRTVKDVINQYNYDPDTIYSEIKKLERNELGHWHDDPQKFPELDLSWYSPEIINNSIIEVGKDYQSVLTNVIPQLKELGCKHIEFRFDSNILNTDILRILTMLDESKIRGVFIIQKYSCITQIEDYIKHFENFPRLMQVILYCYDQSKHGNLSSNDINTGGKILLTPENLDNSHCGFISTNKFVSNIDTYTESINYNSCLNKKISIDPKGNIKNCPAMKTIHGNVKTDSLINIINQDVFKTLWSITKDNIEKCNHCEFRHVCTDCRAFLDDPNNIRSKPLKCGYDPATGIWENWSQNPLKQEAITFYGLTQQKV